jgi:hypothetical protein
LSNQRWLKDADGALHPVHAPSTCLEVRGNTTTAGGVLQVRLLLLLLRLLLLLLVLWRCCNK